MSKARKSYPSDVSDVEWEFLLPYLTLMREDAPQREHALRDVFDALRYVVKTGCQWDFLPHDFPPWAAVYQQARRWVAAGVFEEIAHDLRMILPQLGFDYATPGPAGHWQALCPACKWKSLSAAQLRIREESRG